MEEGKEGASAGEAGGSGKPRLPEENSARVVGRVVNPPRVKDGTGARGEYKMARFVIAANRSYKDSSGKWVRETDFIPVVCWGALAAAAGKAGKGTALRVEGRIKTWAVEGKQYRWELKADALQILDLKRAGAAAAQKAPEKQEELLAA